jgi:hypothetical protein
MKQPSLTAQRRARLEMARHRTGRYVAAITEMLSIATDETGPPLPLVGDFNDWAELRHQLRGMTAAIEAELAGGSSAVKPGGAQSLLDDILATTEAGNARAAFSEKQQGTKARRDDSTDALSGQRL